MWARLKRLFRAIFGGLISSAEDPKLILEQLIRDMQDEVPKQRDNVAQVMSAEKRLERELEHLVSKITELDGKVKALIRVGKDDLATGLLTELKTLQATKTSTEANLATARQASKQARDFFDNYLSQINKRQAQARQLIAQSKQAELQDQLARAMQSFSASDYSKTFDDMTEKIDQRLAEAAARAELASSSLDARMYTAEKEIADLEAADDLLAYKRQMGLIPAEEENPPLGEGAPGFHRELNPASDDEVDLDTSRLRERDLVRN